jgi:hypothetical protein
MQKANFAEARKDAERAGLLGSGDYLKLKEGSNRLRLMSICIPHASEYQGRKTFKWLCYVIDRVDGKVKPFFMPHTIFKQIEALQMNPDYEFDTVPMPFDLTINAKGAGTKEVEYTIVPARKNTALSPAETEALSEMKPLKEFQTALLEKKKEQPREQVPVHTDDDHTAPVNEDDCPF